MTTLYALITFAAETIHTGEESKTPFYVAGGALAAWALIVSALGLSRKENFPGSRGAANAVMAISVVLVVAAMAASVVTG